MRGKRLVIPTAAEILRIKAWLALSRNQTRDYLDIAALATQIGLDEAAGVLAGIDDYYADINTRPEAVATQLKNWRDELLQEERQRVSHHV